MAADTAADEIILSPEVEKVIASATERLASESSSNGSASPASATPERKRRGRKPRVAPVSTLNGTTTLAAATPVVAAIGAPDSAATPVRKRRGRPPGSKNAVSRSAVPAASSATTATTAQATPATTAAKRRGRKPRAAVISLAPTPVAAKRNGVAATPRSITRTSFTVHYVVDVTIVASDIGDALRQAQARGATEVLAVTAN
ncbi:MAG TPA: hypothetical protein VGQ62_18885 [Chloroflexota bacterium]|nr:hypothetical protein [Chloroflexota bacterium]